MCRSLRAWSAAALSLACWAILFSPALLAQQAEPRPSASEQKILTALEEQTELQFVEQPLSDVVEFLQERHGIQIRLDVKALTDAGLGSDTPVTLNIHGITLASALDLLLSGMELSYTIRDEVLYITSKAVAETLVVTKTYPVADLLEPGEGWEEAARRDDYDYQSLIQLITCSIRAARDETGGPSSIQEFRSAQALVISQTFQVHREIEKLLAALRAVKKEHVGNQPQAAAEAVQDDETFYVVVYRLPAAWRYHVTTGHMAPPAGGAAPDATPQSGDGKPAAESPKAPKTVLPQMGMGGMGMGGLQPRTSATAEELAKAIPAVIEPDSWDINGGEGSVRCVDHKLLVRQTRPVHRQIEQLLKELR